MCRIRNAWSAREFGSDEPGVASARSKSKPHCMTQSGLTLKTHGSAESPTARNGWAAAPGLARRGVCAEYALMCPDHASTKRIGTPLIPLTKELRIAPGP